MFLKLILSFFIFSETLPPIKIHDFFSEDVCNLVKISLTKKNTSKINKRKYRLKKRSKKYSKKRKSYKKKTSNNKIKSKKQNKKSSKNLNFSYCTLISPKKFKKIYLAMALKNGKKYLLFSGSLYKEGDFILIDRESYKILRISLDKIILEKDKKCYILPVALKINS